VTVITAGWPQLLPESDLLRIIRPAPEAFARLKPVSAQKISTTYKNNLTIHLLEHPVPPVFNTKHASQTGNFAYPHLTARDFPIRLQPFMS
ncbi:hypothetical protein, partial [Escherichia coli]|uniref:hypothetical protein n=1 Tax=Escherichia coli TaxID=562 RepID=UPI00200C39A2